MESDPKRRERANKARQKNGTSWLPEMPGALIEMFRDGWSREEFCSEYGIGEDTFSRFIEKYPEFAEAYEQAKLDAKAYYLTLKRKHIVEHHEGSKLNIALYNRTMNTRFNLPSQRKLKVKNLASAKSIDEKMDTILKAVENGELTAIEATQLARVVESAVKVNQHSELEKRLAEIEKAARVGVNEEDFEEVEEELKGDI